MFNGINTHARLQLVQVLRLLRISDMVPAECTEKCSLISIAVAYLLQKHSCHASWHVLVMSASSIVYLTSLFLAM
jgi:hypothetical protein